MSNSFDRFQVKNKTVRKDAQKILNNSFIFNGYMSTDITYTSGSLITHYQAAVVNQQEKDDGYVYTQLSNPLTVGNMYQAKDNKLSFLVDEEFITIKDVGWNKYHFFICNLMSDGIYGYFIGPEKSHIDLELQQRNILFSKQKPVLVLSKNQLQLYYKDKIMINNRCWIVDEYDSISSDGVSYYSLLPSTMSKEIIEANSGKSIFVERYDNSYENIDIVEPQEKDGYIYVTAGQTIALTTEDGYFNTTCKELEILSHNSTSITFEIPYGIEEFSIKTKEEGAIVTENYRVVSHL